MTEEPSYLMFARANVKDGIPSSAVIVRALIARLDEQADTIRILARQLEEAEAKSRTSATKSKWLRQCKHCHRDIEYAHNHDSVCARFPQHCSPPRWLHFFNHNAECPEGGTYAHPLETDS